jgi:hypothetical protein
MEKIGSNGSRGGEETARPVVQGRRRTPWSLVVVAVLFVVVPFLTWYWTWFGRSLSDREIDEYLREDNPRHEQHALSQIADQIEEEQSGKGQDKKAGGGASKWNPQVVALAANPVADVRMTAAWVMGLEHASDEFHAALLRLLDDPEPIVRRNAALALVRFGDPRCREELLAMLRPFVVKSSGEGTTITALRAGTPVKRGSLLAKFRSNPSGTVEEIRSPLPGTIQIARTDGGDIIEPGNNLFVIAPDAEQVSDALVGLYYFGDGRDLADVERYAGGVEGMPDDVKEKAAQTAEAIKRRASK